MIAATHEDIVKLSGSLVKNQWLTIKAAANLLLRDHPTGIIIDCADLAHVSEDGARTFLDAMKDIQAEGARIVVCNLPEAVLSVIRCVPGVRSQLPIADSVEDARASLELSGASPGSTAERQPYADGIVVPLLPQLDVEHALSIAGRLAREARAPVHLVYLLEVARHLPLTTPLPEEEAAANRMMCQAMDSARKQNLLATTHLERVRGVDDGLLQILRNYRAAHVVLGAFADHVGEEGFHELVDVLLHRAPCAVLIGRKAPANGANGNGQSPGSGEY